MDMVRTTLDLNSCVLNRNCDKKCAGFARNDIEANKGVFRETGNEDERFSKTFLKTDRRFAINTECHKQAKHNTKMTRSIKHI